MSAERDAKHLAALLAIVVVGLAVAALMQYAHESLAHEQAHAQERR